jgi:hypothetical protein
LEARGLCGGNVKSLLEVLVQDIEQAVCETPHEEQDGDERYLNRSVTIS